MKYNYNKSIESISINICSKLKTIGKLFHREVRCHVCGHCNSKSACASTQSDLRVSLPTYHSMRPYKLQLYRLHMHIRVICTCHHGNVTALNTDKRMSKCRQILTSFQLSVLANILSKSLQFDSIIDVNISVMSAELCAPFLS